jgi:hypothetical protein
LSETKEKPNLLPATLSRSLGSAESRAAARAIVSETPVFITQYTRPGDRDENGTLIGGPIECDSQTATVNGKLLHREPGESLADFRRRAVRSCPAMVHGFVRMHGDGDEPPSR